MEEAARRPKRTERQRAYKKKTRKGQRPGRVERLNKEVQAKTADVTKLSRRTLALNRIATQTRAENLQLKK